MLRYWVGFNQAKGVGPARLRALIQYFGDIKTAWNASPEAWAAAGLDQRTIASLSKTRAACDLDAEIAAVERIGAHILTLDDPGYPPLLREIPDPPPVLYVRGTLIDTDRSALAVVGTRRATAYGNAMTQQIVGPLARQGITIVSGLARGIDGAAHQAALDAGGRTIAVMASGIDRVYPPEHRALAESIAAHGALISEWSVGEPPEGSHFAPRNRIISGISLGVLVIEAALKSGALMTADRALDQGRDVFAVPGNALSPASKGTNALIQTGAKMVTSAEDILDEFGLDPAQIQAQAEAVQVLPDNPTHATILHALVAASEPQHIDDIAFQLSLPVREVSGALAILELKGLVKQTGILQYVAATGTR